MTEDHYSALNLSSTYRNYIILDYMRNNNLKEYLFYFYYTFYITEIKND